MTVGTTVGEWVAFHARNDPSRLAVIDHHSGRRLSYGAFNDRAARLASALAANYALKKGDRVSILAHNSTDNFELSFALSRLGAIFCPLNWRFTLPELRYIVGDQKPKLMLAHPEFLESARALSEEFNFPLLVSPGDGSPSVYEDLIAKHDPWPDGHFAAGEEDIYIIMYTSGTTGRPKGAIITHKMNFWNAVTTLVVGGMSRDSVNLSPLPQFHISGINVYAGPTFYIGGTVYEMRRVDANQIMDVLKDDAIAISHICGVPSLFQIISDHPDFPQAKFKHLKMIGSGGAAASDSLIRKWATKGVALQQGFGMTETSPSIMALGAAQALEKIGSCGKPLMHAEAKLIDSEGQDIVGPDVVGELCLRGPQVTPGYWKNEAASRSSFSEGGWLRTGDAAQRDSDGYYYIVDRWKDMYKSGGENVYPAEVENLLYNIPAVKEIAVVGMPDPRWGEVGRAYIVLHPGMHLTETEVLNFCQGKLARFKQPCSVRFLEELPHNATGKILKRVLRDEAIREIEQESGEFGASLTAQNPA